MKLILCFGLTLASLTILSTAQANTSGNNGATIKYKEGKALNFDELIIEGQMKRPELSVVTGDEDQDSNGLLRLREDFVDKMTVDASEEIAGDQTK